MIKNSFIFLEKISKGKELAVKLDTKLTPELIREGMSRELIRKINNFRKELGLTIDDKIELAVETENKEIKLALEEFTEEIKSSVQANNINEAVKGNEKECKIGDAKVTITIKKE